MLLQDEQYLYDRVGNPVEIRDWRSENEWGPGSKPVSRKMVYDDLYRLTRIDYQYHPTGSDVWVDPYAAELSDNTRPQPAPHGIPSTGKRVMKQSWSYDWLGNTATSTDDASLFYERSLGTIGNTGYRLTSATQPKLTATYDAAGYMTSMTVLRDGTCVPAALCATQTYQYEWDEVGRLVDATRQDASGPGAHLEYAYDASDNRVRKTVVSNEDERHTVYVFGSLELRLAEFTATGYTVDDSTEVPYLFGHGVRLARVTYTDAADFQTDRRRIFLELGDHLGSTSVVLDHATGELVERSTAFAYGSAESHYRTQRWDHFREDYRFTGKEDDIEVGLIYFGARYLNPQLGRWISADPLAVHAPGKADLNLYAYVHGRVLSAVDPVGLCSNGECSPTGGPPAPDNPPEPNADQLKTEREQTVQKIEDAPAVAKQKAEMAVLQHGQAIEGGLAKGSAGLFLGAVASKSPAVGLGLAVAYLATSASDHDSPAGTRATMFGFAGMALSIRATLSSAGASATSTAGAANETTPSLRALDAGRRSSSTVGAAEAGADLGLPAGMSDAQAANLARFTKKLPAGADGVTIRRMPENGFAFQSEVPGRVPGSFAVYEKQVGSIGQTLQYTKTTVDPAGVIVHVKDKISGSIGIGTGTTW